MTLDADVIVVGAGLAGLVATAELGKSIRKVLSRARAAVAAPVRAFLDRGADFVVRPDLRSLVEGMNALTPDALLPYETVEAEVARDRELDNDFTKDLRIAALQQARSYRGDRLIRVAAPHKLLDPAAGPLNRGASARADLHVARRAGDRPVRPRPARGRLAVRGPVRRGRGLRLRR